MTRATKSSADVGSAEPTSDETAVAKPKRARMATPAARRKPTVASNEESGSPPPRRVPPPTSTVRRSTSAPLRTGVQPEVTYRGRNALGPFVPEAQLR